MKRTLSFWRKANLSITLIKEDRKLFAEQVRRGKVSLACVSFSREKRSPMTTNSLRTYFVIHWRTISGRIASPRSLTVSQSRIEVDELGHYNLGTVFSLGALVGFTRHTSSRRQTAEHQRDRSKYLAIDSSHNRANT